MNATEQDKEYLKGLTVLYVEDEEDTREQFALFLKRIVGELVTAGNGSEGLSAYHRYQPRIIITDILMPVMDGLAMVHEIRKHEKTVPVIVLSAFDSPGYLIESINLGVDKYVTKPVNGARLHETLLECAHKLLAEKALAEQQKLERDALISAKDQAEQGRLAAEIANKAKSDFLAIMSHEIRTPLNTIIGMGDLLAETGLSNEQSEYLAVSKTAGETLKSLIDDILDLSRIEAGMLQLDPVPFNVADCIQQLMDISTVAASAKGVTLTSTMQSGIPEQVIGDSLRLRQILLNLVSNAIKFTDGGGSVNLRVEQLFVSESTHWLRFSVSDTGIGIPQEKLENIFESFRQADSSTTRRYGGSGLGLTISRHLVTLMGGEITVESRLGVGSTFSFALGFTAPDDRSAQAGQQPEQAADSPKKPLSILVVDDNKDNRAVIGAYFRRTIHRVESANDGLEGLNKIKQGGYDLVLLDMQMPVMDGYTTARLVREWEQETGRPPLPLIALTANSFKEDCEKSLMAGCTMHVAKPIHKNELLKIVEQFSGQPGQQPASGCHTGENRCSR